MRHIKNLNAGCQVDRFPDPLPIGHKKSSGEPVQTSRVEEEEVEEEEVEKEEEEVMVRTVATQAPSSLLGVTHGPSLALSSLAHSYKVDGGCSTHFQTGVPSGELTNSKDPC